MNDLREDSDSGHWTGEYLLWGSCGCLADALQKLEDRKTYSPGDIVSTFPDVAGNYGWVHHTFTDSEYPLSTWEITVPYQFKSTVETLEY